MLLKDLLCEHIPYQLCYLSLMLFIKNVLYQRSSLHTSVIYDQFPLLIILYQQSSLSMMLLIENTYFS